MSTPIDLRAKVQQFLLERRNLGFTLDSRGEALLNFVSFFERTGHAGSVTAELTAQWARQTQGGNADMATFARRLANLRPFLRWVQQFDPSA